MEKIYCPLSQKECKEELCKLYDDDGEECGLFMLAKGVNQLSKCATPWVHNPKHITFSVSASD